MVAPVQPSQQDIAYLRAHPEVSDKFNAKFGPGAATRFMRPVPDTARNGGGVVQDIARSAGRSAGEMLAGAVSVAAPGALYAQGFNETDPMFQEVSGEAMTAAGAAPEAAWLDTSYEPQTLPGKAVYYGLPYVPLALGGAAGGRYVAGPLAATIGAGTDAALTEGLGLPREVGSIGGMVASMGAGLPLMFRKPAARLGAEALGLPSPLRAGLGLKQPDAIPPQRISDAIVMQRSSAEEGVPLNVPEALPEPSVMALADAASQYPGAGAPFQAVAREREMLARHAIENKLGGVGQPDVSPGAATTEMTEAATKIIGAESQARTQAAQRAGYSNLPGENVDPQGVTALVAKVDETLAQTGGMSGLKPLLQKFRSQIVDADGNPITNAAVLESLYKQLREGLNRRTSGALVSPDDAISAEDAGKVGPLIDELQTILKTAPSYETGRATFEDISKTVVDPLKDRLEPVIGSAGWKQLRTVMLSPDSLTAKELTPLLQTIEKKSPAAIPNIARVIFERAYDMAFRQRQGKTPPSSPAKFVDYLRNNGIQRQKFEEVVRSVARAQGQNPNLTLNGWNKLLDVLQRTATMPDIGSRTHQRGEITRAAGETIGTDIAEFRPVGFFKRVTRGNAMRKLANILADSNGVQGLVDLSQTKPNTARAAYIVNALLQTARVIENPGTEQ